MTISAPPRPPRPGDPVDRDELEALVNALIEEARRRARRRRLIYTAVAASVALVGVVVFAVSDRAAQSHPNPTQPVARPSLAAVAAAPKIAFLSEVPKARLPKGIRWQGELYVVNIEGSGMRRLARFATSFTRPTWSPDGRMIAFERRVRPDRRAPSRQRGVSGLPRRDLRHECRRQRTTEPHGQRRRRRPGLVSRRADDRVLRDEGFVPGLYVMNADGSAQRRVTPDGFHAWGSAWSPDGRRIAFGSVVGGVGNRRDGEIFVVNVDGSGPLNLTRNPAMDHSATWSPDGRMLAFVSYREGLRNVALYVMNADGSEQRKVTSLSISDSSFSWSPDGRRIAFVSKRDGNDEVYVVNVDGSGLRNLTRNPGRDGHPVWSPDGRTIAFVANRGGNRDIYVMNADGSGQLNLTRHLDQKAFGIAWMPTPRS